jgi:aspartate/methionine/tyrosine aminotransferase
MINPSQRVSKVETYYFAKKLAEIDVMNNDGHVPVINLGVGSPDLLPHSQVIQTLQAECQKIDANRYQAYTGIATLRNAYSQWYEKYFGVHLNPKDEILPLIGSKEAVMHISMAFIDNGDEVLVPNPGYPAYAACTRLAGGTVRDMPLVDRLGWMPDLDLLENEDLTKVKIMWINYPNMPTGAKASRNFFERLIQFAQKHNILICHDNPYAFILNDDPLSILSVEGAKTNALELTSLSKCYNMAGWRVGALCGDKQYLDLVLRFKSNMDSGMYKPIQMAAAKALELDNDWIKDLNVQYSQRKNVAIEILQLLNCKWNKNTASLFVWGELPHVHADDIKFVDEVLTKARVFLTPGSIFGTKGEGYLRISLCSPLEDIKEARDRIQNYLLQNKRNRA